MMDAKTIVNVLENYLKPDAHPVPKPDIEITIDLIQHQAEQIERIKCCYNCKYGYYSIMDEDMRCSHPNGNGRCYFDCNKNGFKDWVIFEPPSDRPEGL